ncbi:hypothetical protein PVAP13_7KG347800 [Panicum virgatum]|uniref:Uncharacterized protein n=1 Tax=Panicum virgatum TaxID=38727 RepID=A0A8T0QI15_PANVG|nr:hypothetical protein PVAP13_7KG347800 [Panicum virgatum]
MRRAGALVGLAAASALVLVLFPAPAAGERRYADLVLALFAALLLGCAAVLLSPARRAVARLARRGVEAAGGPRWFGFAGVVFYAAYVIGDAWRQPPAAAAVSVDKVNGFLVFLAGVWTVNMSVLAGRGSRPAAAEGELGCWEVDVVLP